MTWQTSVIITVFLALPAAIAGLSYAFDVLWPFVGALAIMAEAWVIAVIVFPIVRALLSDV